MLRSQCSRSNEGGILVVIRSFYHAMTTRKRLSGILHAESNKTLGQTQDTELSVEEQLQLMPQRKKQGPNFRQDPRFKDVWVKNDGSVMAVRDMSLDHMCMTIGLWLRNEFSEVEQARLGFTILTEDVKTMASAYDCMDDWLNASHAMATTPALTTMLVRLQGMEGGMEKLESVLKERADQGLQEAHRLAERTMFDRPAFF